MKVDFTLRHFPVTGKSWLCGKNQIVSVQTTCCPGALKEQSGLPWSCVIQPFAKIEGAETSDPLPSVGDVARCKDCYA